MNTKYESFIFEDYSFDAENNVATLRYSFDGKISFEEKIKWNVSTKNYNPEALDQALFGLWIMCGVSYYKAYVPKKIVLKKGALNKRQKDFFDNIYINGLAQFFYTNGLDWQGLIDFPFDTQKEYKSITLPNAKGSLVAIGGGKDSIVAAEAIKELGEEFDCWSVNQAKRFEPIANKLGSKMISVERVIDPLLLKLNSEGALNGHVPITAINSFTGLVLAILLNKKEIVWAIESSTDEPNTYWEHLPVNHQYSKTSYFEKDMQQYIKDFISDDIDHFSVLRSLTELRIAEIFCKNYLEKYRYIYSSCNANFSIGNDSELKWCGKCPKCAFVFTIFAPFMNKEDLIEMFGGNNIFADSSMRGTIEELLGIDGHKPLECVGEVAEVRLAIDKSKKTGNFPELEQFNFTLNEYDYTKWGKNNIPSNIESRVKEIFGRL